MTDVLDTKPAKTHKSGGAARPHLLKVDASPRGEMSISRKLGERYVHHWLAAHPDGTIVERDLSLCTTD
jgi:hypothetical protein